MLPSCLIGPFYSITLQLKKCDWQMIRPISRLFAIMVLYFSHFLYKTPPIVSLRRCTYQFSTFEVNTTCRLPANH